MILALALFACTPDSLDTDRVDTDADVITEPVECDEGTQVGDCAPDFTLPDRDGVDVSLSDFEGDLILINCSAVW